MSFRLERLLDHRAFDEELRRGAREGLGGNPKQMRSRWLWDERADSLYERGAAGVLRAAPRALAAAVLRLVSWWRDEAGDFALCLARSVPERGHAA